MNRHLKAYFLSMLAFCAALAAIPAWAQQTVETQRTREPAHILKPEQAGILLMEARVDLEQPDKTLDYMQLKDGDVVADVGCGNGFYTLRVAERVGPNGYVIAQDIQQGMLDQLMARAEEAGITNIKPLLGKEDDPMLPEGEVDWVLMVDVYHEFSQPEVMLEGIKKCLAPGGKIALLEYRAEQTGDMMPAFIPRDHKMTVQEVMQEWTPAGYMLVERLEFLPAQHFFVFKAGESDGQGQSWDPSASIYPMEVGTTPKTSTFGNFVFFAGQPTAEAFEVYAKEGVVTVLNLRTEPEVEALDFNEQEAVEYANMKYQHIAIGQEPPSKETLESIFDVIEEHEENGQPLLLHCGSSNRVGYIWSMYRGARKGLSADEAIEEGKAAGLRAPELEEHARKVIEEKK